MKANYTHASEAARLATAIIACCFTCLGADSINEFQEDVTNSRVSNPKIIWGDATNFLRGDHSLGQPIPTALRSGIDASNGVVVLLGSPPKALHTPELCIESTLGQPAERYPTKFTQGVPMTIVPSTNWVFAYLPSFNESISLGMTDSKGRPVPKTSEGLVLGQTPGLEPNTPWHRWKEKRYRNASILPKDCFVTGQIDPTKYFRIVQPGVYRLEVTQRVYVADTNGFLRSISLPPAAVDVIVQP